MIGDRLGLYRALAEAGPLTSAELADLHRDRRAVRPRVAAAARPPAGTSPTSRHRPYWLTPTQALAFADPDGLALPGAFQLARRLSGRPPGDHRGVPHRAGVAWGDHDPGVFTGCERFFRPGYVAEPGERVDPGGRRRSTTGSTAGIRGGRRRLRAGRLDPDPGRDLPGLDGSSASTHPESIELARMTAADAGLADRCTFEVAPAQDFPGTGYGLVTTFDCLHDMGDPVAAARHIREALAADGVWMIVEPYAGASVADNLTPVGRGLLLVLQLPVRAARRLRGRRRTRWATRPVRRRSRESCEQAGFGTFRAGRRDPVQHRLRGAAVSGTAPDPLAAFRLDGRVVAGHGRLVGAGRANGRHGWTPPAPRSCSPRRSAERLKERAATLAGAPLVVPGDLRDAGVPRRADRRGAGPARRPGRAAQQRRHLRQRGPGGPVAERTSPTSSIDLALVPIDLCRLAAPLLFGRRGPSVINIASIFGRSAPGAGWRATTPPRAG